MTNLAGKYAGLPLEEARAEIKKELETQSLILNRQATSQSIRVHERCDTPVEYILVGQWFIRVLDFKAQLLQAGEKLEWHPPHVKARYHAWVEGLNWDWCVSRQRYFGVPFPLWYCQGCGAVILADESRLPVDPSDDAPQKPCPSCGSADYQPETDVMDTWATSSMSPQIAGGWLQEENFLYKKVFPFSMRPQAHEIIRTWAFYTIVKSLHHFDRLPWESVAISGWGIAGEGMGKISKSRGGGPVAPLEMIERYSADAVRYWAASTGLGKDAVISEEKIQNGAALVTKLWNVARFCERFLAEFAPATDGSKLQLSPADRWILSRLQRLVEHATALFEQYDYAAAKSEVEQFFWRDLADNYLEMIKQRLYAEQSDQRQATIWALYQVLLTVIKLFAPFLPYVTEVIYAAIFTSPEHQGSIHCASWPEPDRALVDESAETLGETLVDLAIQVRRYKSQQSLSLGADLENLTIYARDDETRVALQAALSDLKSITRARNIEFYVIPEGETGPGTQASARFDEGFLS